MVVGMERFREHFLGLEDGYVLIGGAACDAWMQRSGLQFRRTKDLDIVLVIEALGPAFVDRFRSFVEAGRYEIRVRQETGRREFFRFVRPQVAGFPFMLELFSRAPSGLDLGTGQGIVPVQVDEAAASLSAILMDDGYYELILATRFDAGGIPMVGVEGLIPMKAKAYLDLQKHRLDGGNVDDDDIRKHRNDIFRLALTLTAGPGPLIPPGIRATLSTFLEALPEDSPDWSPIVQALKATVRNPPSPSELLRTIKEYFRLG